MTNQKHEQFVRISADLVRERQLRVIQALIDRGPGAISQMPRKYNAVESHRLRRLTFDWLEQVIAKFGLTHIPFAELKRFNDTSCLRFLSLDSDVHCSTNINHFDESLADT